MKNKEVERKRQAAKRYAKTWKRWSWDAEYGMQVYHSYVDENGNPYKTKGYWDDVAFFEGSQKVVVLWTHPRYQYTEHMSDLAYTEAKTKFPDHSATKDWLNPTKTNYKKVGRSRKKAVSYEMGNIGSAEGFYEFWKEREVELATTTDYTQKCSFVVKQADYCRLVYMCAPIEVISVPTLHELVKLTKQCLKDPYLFDNLYGSYEYTKEHYLKDKEDERKATASSEDHILSVGT